MKKIIVILSFVCVLFSILPLSGYAENKDQENKTFLVGYFSKAEAELEINQLGGEVNEVYENLNIMKVAAKKDLTKYTSQAFSFIEQNQIVTGAAVAESLTGSSNLVETTPWGVEAIKAADAHLLGIMGQGIKVAILDTGIDYSHEDLSVAGGINFVPGISGYVDDNNHGTHLAGIISGEINGIGVIGGAPSANIYSVKVLDRFKIGTIDQVINGIEWSIQNNINIINLSLMTYTNSKAFQKACDTAYSSGILLISAAGNNGASKKDTITYPAKYGSVIAVGGINEQLKRMSTSSIGRDLELVAPGNAIFSTALNNNYTFLSGTSMAAAHVTSIAALVWSAHPEFTNQQIRNILNSTAIPLGSNSEYGNGLVNYK